MLRFSSFFGATPGLEGGCVKVVLTPGDAIIMPADYLHFVETDKEAVAQGMNFLHLLQFPQALQRYMEERLADDPRDECFPNFEALGMMILRHRFSKSPEQVFVCLFDFITRLGGVDDYYVQEILEPAVCMIIDIKQLFIPFLHVGLCFKFLCF